MDRQQELEYFKTSLNLVDYATTFGYEVDKVKSSKNHIVLKSGSDVLIVSVNSDGVWQYFNSQEKGDRGTIIEFLQQRRSLNLGQVRKELRLFGNIQQPVTRPTYSKPQRQINIPKVKAFLKHRTSCKSNAYLNSRGITDQTIRHPAFAGRILDGYKGAVIFPHINEEGFCSYEVCNQDFKHFPDFGEKSLWVSRTPDQLYSVVFVESSIEALSYFQYFDEPENTLFVTGSGNWSEKADQLIIRLIKKHQPNSIKAAFNNDAGGTRQFERLSNILDQSQIDRQIPPDGINDWNSLIRRK